MNKEMEEIMDDNLLSVGPYKGEMDFSINSRITQLSREEMKDFREMVIVAIGVAEQMWGNAQDSKPGNQATSVGH